MNWLYRFALKVYHWLPLPKILKNYLKKNAIKIIPNSLPSISEIWSISAEDINNRPLDRKAKLLSRISPASQDGLEIGPLCYPIVTKIESAGRIRYVDIANAETLRELNKYNQAIPLNEIVETDFILGEKNLPELVGDKLYDYVIASHVIEHVPDMLGWLIEIGEVLKDNGILSLAIPDKRYTFDYLRNLSTSGKLIEDYLVHRRRPGPGEVFDFAFNARKVDVIHAWEGTLDKTTLEHFIDLQGAFFLAKYSLENYKDVHINVLTPASFLDLIEIACHLELMDFTIVDFYDTAHNTVEFIVSMERIPRKENRKKSLSRQLASINRARERIS